MKYNVGYLGICPELEDKLIDYCYLHDNEKINYININGMNKDLIDATSFNGLIFNTDIHNDEQLDKLINSIIKSNPDIDVMPIIVSKDKGENFDSLNEIEKEVSFLKDTTGTSTIPYLINSEREASIFMNTIFSTLSSKTIRSIEQIENYKLGSKDNMMKALKKVVITLEMKDPYTKDHSLRVSNYAAQIAKKMGLPDKEIKEIAEAGWLHDIGKLAINDSVLMKPERLTDSEFSHMRSHAAIGDVLLRNIFQGNEFENVKDYARHHHERFDGRGYPDKIAGEDIPLGARILCLADSFDAMTTQRSYNKPKKLEDAILDLQTNSGSQFDPKVAESFIELLKQEPTMLKETLAITIDNEGYIQVENGPKIKKNLPTDPNEDTPNIEEKEQGI